MPHSYSEINLHVVFSTKDRQDLISKEIRATFWAYIIGIGENQGILIRAIGGTTNHLHALFQLPSDVTLATVVRLLKSNSSKWMNTKRQLFAWQEGYAAFSVSASNLNSVTQYIRNQETHHQKITFEQEFLALLNKHRVPYDPKFVFG